MFALLSRRRLVLHLRQIRAGGQGTNPLQYIPGTTPLSRSYSPAGVSADPSSEPCPTTFSYLISCGISPAVAAAAAKTRYGRIRSTAKADAVFALLRSYGFGAADITRVVRGAPLLLSIDPDRIIRPKLDFFASLGLEPRHLAISPIVIALSLDKHLVPCVQFLRGLIGNDDDVRLAISRIPRALTVGVEKNMRPAVEALHHHGLTQETISKLLVIQLGVLMLPPARIGEIIEELMALGLCVTDNRFLYCFKAVSSIKKETWLRKRALYQSFGFSDSEVLKAFKTQPTMVNFAEEAIKKKLRFFFHELKLEPSDIIRCPVILAYSFEKTILPRCAVLNVLMGEGKIGEDIRLPHAILGNSRNFSEKYVLRYAVDVPDVIKAYEGKIKFEGFQRGGIKVLEPKGQFSRMKSL